MLSTLITYNSSVTEVYNEFIAGIKFYLYLLNLEEFFIRGRQKIITDIYIKFSIPLLMFSYIYWKITDKIQCLMILRTNIF